MKKIEASMIKRLMRISSQPFSTFSLELSLSHTLGHLEFSWSTLGGVWHTWDLEQEGEGKVGNHKRTVRTIVIAGFSCRYRVACMISLLVLACMAHACGFLVMICHWHG